MYMRACTATISSTNIHYYRQMHAYLDTWNCSHNLLVNVNVYDYCETFIVHGSVGLLLPYSTVTELVLQSDGWRLCMLYADALGFHI